MHSISDSELIDRFNQGEQGIVEIIFNRYWKELFDHAHRMVGSEETAKDIVQEIFLRLITRGSINGNMPLSVMLHVAVKNEVINRYRRDKVKQKYLGSIDASVFVSNSSPDDTIFVKQLREILLRETAYIPAEQLRCLILRTEHNLNVKEIASITGKSSQTVKILLLNARRKLKGALAKYLPQSLHWLKRK